MSQDIVNIVNSLTNDAKVFYSKANTYRDYAELDGCLINLTLAANNLYQAINILNKHTSQPDAETKSTSTELVILERGKNNYLDSKLCSNTECKTQLETILRQILEEIRPLQQKQRSLKSSGTSGSSREKDNDTLDCDFVKEVFLEGKENCIDFSDVVGCNEAKDKITECFINTFIYPNLFRNRTRALLFYGPPGTGKTMIVKAAINELKLSAPNLNIHFFAPLAADLKGKYVGETEKKIKAYFECASLKACESEQETKNGMFQRNLSILFLDEIEALAGSRSAEGSGEGMTSSVNTLLQMMDGVSTKPNLVVIGATNYPWKLDGAILRRFPTRIFIDLPKKEDVIKLIFQEYADFVKINLDETIGKYDEKTRKFVKDEDKGYLLLKIKKDKDGNNELFDDIDQHCDKTIREKEDEELQLDNPKQTHKDSFCMESLQKRLEKTNSNETYSNNIISKRSYEILFNDAYIGVLSYGLNLKEKTGELLSGNMQSNHAEYIKKKKEFIYKKLVLDVSELAEIMVSKLFSNSDIRTFMRDRYFPLLSYESLKIDKKRYVLEINDRTFHVDKRSLDCFSPFFKDLKSTQIEDDTYGTVSMGKTKYQKYIDIKYSDLFQLDSSAYFDMYWIDPNQLVEIRGEKVAIPTDCSQYVSQTFLQGSFPMDEFFLNRYKSNDAYEQSTPIKLFAKIRGKPIFIETQYKYLCNIQAKIMQSFDEIYTDMKYYLNKDSENSDYFQKVSSLSIPDVSSANSQKLKTYSELQKLTKIDTPQGSRWEKFKQYFTGIDWSTWPRLRKFMYWFTSSTDAKQKQMNDEFFEEERRIEEFRQKEYNNLVFENNEKETKDYMSKILMNQLNMQNIFFVEQKKCINLMKICQNIIKQMPEDLNKLSFMTALEITYFTTKYKNIQYQYDSFQTNGKTQEQINRHNTKIYNDRAELRRIIVNNFCIDRLICKAVENCLKLSSIQSYEDFTTNFITEFTNAVDNIAYVSLLYPNDEKEENSAASIFAIRKKDFDEGQITQIKNIPVFSGSKQNITAGGEGGSVGGVLNCRGDSPINSSFLSRLTDDAEYVVYYKFQGGDKLIEIQTKLKNSIKEMFDKAINPPKQIDAKDFGRQFENDSEKITLNFSWEACLESFQLQIDAIEKTSKEIVSENSKLFRTFQINPRYSIQTLLDENKKESYFQASTIKSDYAEMKYYEDTRIAPDTKERKKKAYKEMATKYAWAKDLKVDE